MDKGESMSPIKQRTHELLTAISVAPPAEIQEVAKELEDKAKDHASNIFMRPIYRDMAKLLKKAAGK
jgi:hypothetical protein